MTNAKQLSANNSYDAHARTCAPDDFRGQIRRTVNGTPIAKAQIDMILAALRNGLQLQNHDNLLELACGNGSLSVELFDTCQGYQGTDISEYLISIAQQHFERQTSHIFHVQSGVEYVDLEPNPERFTRALCYAGFQYFSDADARHILATLHERFSKLERMFIGNMPDRARAHNFYTDRIPSEEDLNNHETALGVWRTQEAFFSIADAAGWQVTVSLMPADFYATHYRFDALLTRKE